MLLIENYGMSPSTLTQRPSLERPTTDPDICMAAEVVVTVRMPCSVYVLYMRTYSEVKISHFS